MLVELYKKELKQKENYLGLEFLSSSLWQLNAIVMVVVGIVILMTNA